MPCWCVSGCRRHRHDEAQIARVAYLVGHHHTLRNIHGPDYQILIEADYIANASENWTRSKTASGNTRRSVLGISCKYSAALTADGEHAHNTQEGPARKILL